MTQINNLESVTPNHRRQIFGSFHLSNCEFAISVSCVQEVVNTPPQYTPVPLSPAYLLGLFNLRGTVVPVIDLKKLLSLKEVSGHESHNIAIVELNGALIGLLFDKTGEVFKDDPEQRSDFESASDIDVISGVFKKDSGRRIVQILNIEKIFSLKNVPKNSGGIKHDRDGQKKKRGNRKQCISFVVGPAKCALPISDIQEILKIDKLGESALGVGFCIGTIDLRGLTVPVIDFSALLGYREVERSDSAVGGDRRLVVMKLGGEHFGLVVDSVDSIISYFADELISFPLLDQKRDEMFMGCITGHGDTDVLLLDHEKILSNSEVAEITHGHSKIYQSQSKISSNEKLKSRDRKTYILFSINGSFAVPISDVKEIIEYPSQLLHPPGIKSHVKGVLNLRGEMVTIIDARKLYTQAEGQIKKNDKGDNEAQSKILVFKREKFHFGLIVDSVESIITISESDKIKLPELLYSQGEDSLTKDISEAVEVSGGDGKKISMLIVSVDSIAARASRSLAA